jgi:hypothetical protein
VARIDQRLACPYAATRDDLGYPIRNVDEVGRWTGREEQDLIAHARAEHRNGAVDLRIGPRLRRPRGIWCRWSLGEAYRGRPQRTR